MAGLQSESDLQAWRSQYLGRSAMVMQIFKRLPEAPKEERPRIGQFANQVKTNLEEKLAERMEAVKASALQENLKTEALDVTLPGRKPSARSFSYPKLKPREKFAAFSAIWVSRSFILQKLKVMNTTLNY